MSKDKEQLVKIQQLLQKGELQGDEVKQVLDYAVNNPEIDTNDQLVRQSLEKIKNWGDVDSLLLDAVESAWLADRKDQAKLILCKADKMREQSLWQKIYNIICYARVEYDAGLVNALLECCENRADYSEHMCITVSLLVQYAGRGGAEQILRQAKSEKLKADDLAKLLDAAARHGNETIINLVLNLGARPEKKKEQKKSGVKVSGANSNFDEFINDILKNIDELEHPAIAAACKKQWGNIFLLCKHPNTKDGIDFERLESIVQSEAGKRYKNIMDAYPDLANLLKEKNGTLGTGHQSDGQQNDSPGEAKSTKRFIWPIKGMVIGGTCGVVSGGIIFALELNGTTILIYPKVLELMNNQHDQVVAALTISYIALIAISAVVGGGVEFALRNSHVRP